jgi:Tol biopolymer transport system component
LVFSTGQSPWMLPMIGLPAGSASDGKVFVYDTSSQHLTILTPGVGSDTFPVWSPDGSRIAFVSDNDIWVMNADGSHLQRVTNDGAPKLMLAWAPG